MEHESSKQSNDQKEVLDTAPKSEKLRQALVKPSLSDITKGWED